MWILYALAWVFWGLSMAFGGPLDLVILPPSPPLEDDEDDDDDDEEAQVSAPPAATVKALVAKRIEALIK
jgi:hypothetical protein